ncbi:MAG: hypothetical protein A2756_02800 [Candidatus Ryanbacteria bacterium RIFCSPHIGHO2_01_FULL_48_27]|uniref:Excinuclease ABC subunit C n=1 Tax=Candidatus Ryanbacteria bacterium RIFCSPHIGHO2_01_FULL_48_27 TaxID=1802115 RepID=A0A1G2G749_9BACT|nr:MAG: hypothetical protein A2756_02800 [Candidatus Ryanbacteria bacterium RIFCSPHIGHO2_01_FULL_48_27]
MPVHIETIRGHVPSTPGVYFFKGARGQILYIGKAGNLKTRIRSYFAASRDVGPAKERMLKEAVTLEWQELSSEIEALIEEARLIKKYRPRYNILMRDDKNYLYVGFTKERFPKVFLTHQPRQTLSREFKDKKATYIGPFTDATSVKRILKSLRKLFPYCTCKELHTRLCQNAQIGLCLGACCLNTAKPTYATVDTNAAHTLYKQHVASIQKILSGNQKTLIRMLTKKMETYSKDRAFEKAASIRNQLWGLEHIFAHSLYIKQEHSLENQKALRKLEQILRLTYPIARIEGYDISNIQGTDAVGSMVVCTDGVMDKNEYRKFRIKTVVGANDPAMMQEILMRRFNHPKWQYPEVILIDGGVSQLNAARWAQKKYLHQAVHNTNTWDTVAAIHIVSLAKREEELYLPGKIHPIALKHTSTTLLHLLQQIRDESHRFAIGFHRKLHRKLPLR